MREGTAGGCSSEAEEEGEESQKGPEELKARRRQKPANSDATATSASLAPVSGGARRTNTTPLLRVLVLY